MSGKPLARPAGVGADPRGYRSSMPDVSPASDTCAASVLPRGAGEENGWRHTLWAGRRLAFLAAIGMAALACSAARVRAGEVPGEPTFPRLRAGDPAVTRRANGALARREREDRRERATCLSMPGPGSADPVGTRQPYTETVTTTFATPALPQRGRAGQLGLRALSEQRRAASHLAGPADRIDAVLASRLPAWFPAAPGWQLRSAYRLQARLPLPGALPDGTGDTSGGVPGGDRGRDRMGIVAYQGGSRGRTADAPSGPFVRRARHAGHPGDCSLCRRQRAPQRPRRCKQVKGPRRKPGPPRECGGVMYRRGPVRSLRRPPARPPQQWRAPPAGSCGRCPATRSSATGNRTCRGSFPPSRRGPPRPSRRAAPPSAGGSGASPPAHVRSPSMPGRPPPARTGACRSEQRPRRSPGCRTTPPSAGRSAPRNPRSGTRASRAGGRMLGGRRPAHARPVPSGGSTGTRTGVPAPGREGRPRGRDMLDVIAADGDQAAHAVGPQGRRDASRPAAPVVARDDRGP